MSRGTVAVLVLLAVLWASAFPVIKIALEGLSPAHLTLARHLAASLAFVAFLAVLKRPLVPARRDWPALLGLGAIGIFVYHLCLNTGQLRVSAGATSLIVATAPLLTAVVATVLGRERLSSLGWAGSALGFMGVALIVLGDPSANGAATAAEAVAASGAPGAAGAGAGAALAASFEPYALFVLVSALSAALFAVLQRPLLVRYRPMELMAYVTWAGTVPMLLFLPGLGEALLTAPARSAVAALALGVVPSAVAYTLFALALARAPATLVTPYLYLVPVFALLFSWWWLGEVPTSLTAVGGVVVVTALTIVHVARRRAASRAAAVPRPIGD